MCNPAWMKYSTPYVQYRESAYYKLTKERWLYAKLVTGQQKIAGNHLFHLQWGSRELPDQQDIL
jgi:hypothetical protein